MFETVGRTRDPDYWLRQVVSGCLTFLLVATTITGVVLWWLAKLLWPILRSLLEALWLALFGTQLPPMIDAWFVEVPVVVEVVEDDPEAGDIGVLVEIVDEVPGEADLAEMLAPPEPEPMPEPDYAARAAVMEEAILSSGLLAVLGTTASEELWGDDVLAAGLSGELSMLVAAEDGASWGSGGLGLSGAGEGGGGTGEGTIGLGSIGTIGHGGGGGSGSGYGSGGGRVSAGRYDDEGDGVEGGVIGGVEGGVVGGVLSGSSARAVGSGGGGTLPEWTKRAKPEHPGVDGTCKATVRVDDRGRFESVAWKSCPSELRDTVRDALERSRWTPATRGGEPVSGTVEVVFRFEQEP